MGTSFKDFKSTLTPVLEGTIGVDAIGPRELENLQKFAQQISQAFQPSLPQLLERIELELNKYGYSLGELDMEMPFDENGEEDFLVVKYNDSAIANNVVMTLSWNRISGKQYDYRSDGSALINSVTLEFHEQDGDSMDSIFEHFEIELISEAVDSVFIGSLKRLSDSQLRQKLRYYRDKDEAKYNAIVSEIDHRGIKE